MSKQFILPLLLLIIFGLAVPAGAQNPPPIALTAQAGFDGFYKDGLWIPVTVTVANNGPAVEGQLQITIGNNFSGEIHYTSPIALPTQSNKQVTLYVLPPSPVSSFTVALLDDKQRVVAEVESNRLTPIAISGLLYGVVSNEDPALDFLETVTGTRPDAKVALLDIEQLPEAGAAWNPIDILIMTNVDTGRLTANQLAALTGWLALGGQLVVTGGGNWQATTAGLAHLLPVTVNGSQTFNDLPSLSNFAATSFVAPGPYLVATSTLQSGEIRLHENNLPLLVSHSWGKGTVYFLALEPGAAPLLNWPGQPALWNEVVAQLPTSPLWAGGPQNGYAAGEAVKTLPNLRLPSVIAFVFFLLFYTLVIGPLNYFVINRLKRRELAWLTIPAIILFFTVLAYLTGFALRGNKIIVNQMAIAYGQMGSETVRVNSLVGLYSPKRANYDLILPTDTLIRPFNGNDGSLVGVGNLEAVSYGNGVTLEQVRVDVSSMETFVAESYRPGPAISGRVTLNLDPALNTVDIYIQNNSQSLLEDVGILVGNDYFRVGNLQPGEAHTTSESLTTSPTSYYSNTGLDYSEVFDSYDYSNDPKLFPRYQLLESLVNYSYSSYNPSLNYSDTAILFAWSSDPQLEIQLDEEDFNKIATTLYLLEMPTEHVADSAGNFQLPNGVVERELLNYQGIYDTSLVNFYMPVGWLEVEFTPWESFANLQIDDLAIVLRPPDYVNSSTPQPIPEVRLWHWQEARWVVIPDIIWGETPIANPTDYIGTNNRVRIYLQNNDYNGINILEFYPLYTGRVE